MNIFKCTDNQAIEIYSHWGNLPILLNFKYFIGQNYLSINCSRSARAISRRIFKLLSRKYSQIV